MSGLRIFLAGQRSFGAAVLTSLREMAGVTVVGVSCPVTDEDRLYVKASQWGYPLIPAGMLTADRLPEELDLMVCAHAHDFVGRKTRLKTRLGAIGYHPSLLPLHRGRDAIYWTLRFQDKVTGGSVYWLNDAVDAGDIAAQDWCFVQPDDTVHTLWRRDLFPMGLRLIEQTLREIQAGVIVAIPQDEALATWEPSRERPPLRRPDLPLLGTRAGYTVVREKQAVRRGST